MKGCPYDNAVAEATFKIMKTEFIHKMHFQSLNHLNLELSDYVNWYNNHRIHGTLGYMSSVNYRKLALENVVWFSVDNPNVNFELANLISGNIHYTTSSNKKSFSRESIYKKTIQKKL